MRYLLILLLVQSTLIASGQIINQNHSMYNVGNPQECGITADPNALGIIVQTVYRAKPDGYQIIFTKSFIGKDVETVEALMNKKTDSLIRAASSLGIKRSNVLAEITSLDPIFEIGLNTSSEKPAGYKITENITFDVQQFSTIRYLAKTCLDFEIYDIVHVTPYVLNPDAIYDTLAEKSVEILNFKKELSKKIGYSGADGKAYFRKCRNVYYPTDMDLKATIHNSRMYMHSLDQNSEIDLRRSVQVDAYNNLDLRSVDYVFHPNTLEPTIDFHYRIDYNYIFPPEEEEEESQEQDGEKVFYILTSEGELQKLEFGSGKKKE